MKKLLIIQKDSAYFLFETIQLIEKYQSAFKEYETTLLADKNAAKEIHENYTPLIKGIVTDEALILDHQYDLSVNFSLNEASWAIHGNIQSGTKLGPYISDNQLLVQDLWSTYLMTLKARAPFLTFHLQDIYKNILGIKSQFKNPKQHRPVTAIVFKLSSPDVFPAEEQERFITSLSQNYPNIPIVDISEVDLVSDLSGTLYIGPTGLQALKICEAGARGVFLSSAFQGFNFMPGNSGHLLLSSKGATFDSGSLLKILGNFLIGKTNISLQYSAYTVDQDTIHGSYIKSLNASDINYPFYQSHVVLWNFLLSLTDVDLEVSHCGPEHQTFLRTNLETLKKLIRLHSYAMVSVDKIYQEAKSKAINSGIIEGHLKNLKEIELLFDKISASHAMIRPFLDFYRIRRGQGQSETPIEQIQSSYLLYSEEHQALEALKELFLVTLSQNEVNI